MKQPSRQVYIQKTYKRHSALNIHKTSNLSLAVEPKRRFNFEPNNLDNSDMNAQCIYISIPENTKILFYHLIIFSMAFAA